MFDEVLINLLGKEYSKVEAKLFGYQCRQVSGEIYPAIIENPAALTMGFVLFDVNPIDIARLDEFEGEYYYRSVVSVIVNEVEIQAETYMFKDKYYHLLSEKNWDVSSFRSLCFKHLSKKKQ